MATFIPVMADVGRSNRRKFIASAVGVSLCGLAGCSGMLETDGESTTERTQTTTRTRTATPEPASFQISVEAPDVVNADEDFRYELTVENTGEKRGWFSSNVKSRWTTEASWGYVSGPDGNVGVRVEAGETKTEEFEMTAPPEQGTREYRISTSETEAKWDVDVTTENATPDIEFVNLVSEWSQYGDAEDNAIDRTSTGEPIAIAYRYSIFSHSGTVDSAHEVRIYEARTNDQVTSNFTESENLVDFDGYSEWEFWHGFRTDDWGAGEYRVEVTVRDSISNEVSETHETTFELE